MVVRGERRIASLFPHGEKGILHDIGRQIAVAHDAHRERVRRLAVPVVEPRECLPVAARDKRQQPVVGEVFRVRLLSVLCRQAFVLGAVGSRSGRRRLNHGEPGLDPLGKPPASTGSGTPQVESHQLDSPRSSAGLEPEVVQEVGGKIVRWLRNRAANDSSAG